MKKLSIVLVYVALSLGLKAQCPTEVDNFVFTDCHGTQYDLYELLDGRHYVLVHFLTNTDNNDATWRFVEKYHNFGCNGKDVFFIEILPGSNDSVCMDVEQTYHAEMPLVSADGGGAVFHSTYNDCIYYGGNARYLLLLPDHTIYQDPVSLDNIVEILDGFGIQPSDCSFGNCTAPTDLVLTHNGDRMSLSWTGSENASYYHLYWSQVYSSNYLLKRDVVGTVADFAPYRPASDNYYYVVSRCDDGSENVSEELMVEGDYALDASLIDCHGNPMRLFDILDRGQYVFIDYFWYSCGGCRAIVKYIEEAYYYYGCNKEDVFFMEITRMDHDNLCQMWEEELGVEYPTVGIDGGGLDFCLKYYISMVPCFVLIAPDYTIALHSWRDGFLIDDFQSIKDAFDSFGIEEHQCGVGVNEDKEMKFSIFPNPVDDFLNLSVESSSRVRVYNSLGQLMDSFIPENGQVGLRTEHYPDGLYILQVDGKTGRFMVRH